MSFARRLPPVDRTIADDAAEAEYAGDPWFVELPVSQGNGLTKDSGADAFQTKSVSLSRFVDRLGEMTCCKGIAHDRG